MTYNVFGVILNLALSIYRLLEWSLCSLNAIHDDKQKV